MAALRSASPALADSPLHDGVGVNDSEQEVTIIGSYQHKGGVAKTTFVINLAHSLVAQGLCVLLVDADPQCNLTNHYLNTGGESEAQHEDDSDELKEEEEEEEEEKSGEEGEPIVVDGSQESEEEEEKVITGWGGRKPIKLMALKKVDFPELHKHAKVPSQEVIETGFHPKNLKTALETAIIPFTAVPLNPLGVTPAGHLFLIPGSPLLHRMENRYQDSVLQALPEVAMKTLGSFRKLLKETAGHPEVKAQIVLVDFGPSSGLLNMAFATSCDALIPTYYADFYCTSSSESLLYNVLPDWQHWHKRKVKSVNENKRRFKETWAAYRMTDSMPRLFPFIASRFRSTTTKKTAVEHVGKGASDWLKAMQRLVTIGLVPNKPPPPSIKELYLPFGDEMVLPLIPDMGVIVQMTHEHGTGFAGCNDWALLKKRFGRNSMVKSYQEKIRTVTRRFTSVAKNVHAFHRYRNNKNTYGIYVSFEGGPPNELQVNPPGSVPPGEAAGAAAEEVSRGRGRGRGRGSRGGRGGVKVKHEDSIAQDDSDMKQNRGRNKRRRGS